MSTINTDKEETPNISTANNANNSEKSINDEQLDQHKCHQCHRDFKTIEVYCNTNERVKLLCI